MTISANHFEQSEHISAQNPQVSPFQLEALSETPSSGKRSTAGATDLVMNDIWSALKTTSKDSCPTTQQPDLIPKPRVERLPDIPIAAGTDSMSTDDPSEENFKRLRFDKTGSISTFTTAEEVKRIMAYAEEGQRHADAQEVQFIKQWGGINEIGPLAPPTGGDDPANYTHLNADQSSYTVSNGRISEFKTAPTKDRPDGIKYTDIKYDTNGLVESYSNSLGQTYSRVGRPDDRGLAVWQGIDNESGIAENYGKSNKWNVAIDANGIHIFVGSGKYYGTMISRDLDGSQVLTRLKVDGNDIVGLETATTLPDNTKVSQTGRFRDSYRRVEHVDLMDVKEADGKYWSHIP